MRTRILFTKHEKKGRCFSPKAQKRYVYEVSCIAHDVLTGVYSIVGSKYNIVVKGIDMHEAGTLNQTYYDGIIVLTQRTADR